MPMIPKAITSGPRSANKASPASEAITMSVMPSFAIAVCDRMPVWMNREPPVYG